MKILLITERSAWGAAAGAFLESRQVGSTHIACVGGGGISPQGNRIKTRNSLNYFGI